ncbi:hypothetical protein CMV00_11780 [Elizabethkingia anophelis]|nr:hypothetical protein [Elizabethkingia anophelis]
MSHIGLKLTKEIKIDFNLTKTIRGVKLPDKSKELIEDYLSSNKFAEEYDSDLLLQTDDSLIYGFEFLHKGKKMMIPEINPVTIYFSNAVMSNTKIADYKRVLVEKAQNRIIQVHFFGDFFQLSFNCIINLQSSIETLINKLIQDHKYVFYDKNGKIKNSNILDKIDIALPKISTKDFEKDFKNEYNDIKNLIKIRNQMIHLKPDEKTTNTKYKIPYRKIIEFNFDTTIESVKKFINYYEPNLIEECTCGQNFYFDIIK